VTALVSGPPEAVVEAMARAYWHHLTPYASQVGETYEADPHAVQYRDAARVMYGACVAAVVRHLEDQQESWPDPCLHNTPTPVVMLEDVRALLPAPTDVGEEVKDA